MITQIYMEDIVFGGMSSKIVKHFVQKMQTEFEMSLVGELTYFLGFQLKPMKDEIFISQSKCATSIVKNFGLEMLGLNTLLLPLMTNLVKMIKELLFIKVSVRV